AFCCFLHELELTQLSVLRSLTLSLAFNEMKFCGRQRTKAAVFPFLDFCLQGRRESGFCKTRDGEMRHKRFFLASDAERRQGQIHLRGERCKIRRRFDANPRDAGPPCVWE